MNKRALVLGICLVFVNLFLVYKSTITTYTISETASGINPFLGLSLILSFLVVLLGFFSKDSLQARLEEMEQEKPSSAHSLNTKKSLLNRIRDKVYFATRKVERVNGEYTAQKYVGKADYVGFKELYDYGVDKRIKGFFQRFKPIDNLVNEQKKQEYVTALNSYTKRFQQELTELFPEEDREKILDSLSKNEDVTYEAMPTDIARFHNGSERNILSGKVSSENFIAVHKTNFLPENKKMITYGSANFSRKEYDDKKVLGVGAERQTIHFTLNCPVSANIGGDWGNKKYAILIPSEKIMKNNIATLSPADTYAFGEIPLVGKSAELIISRKAFHRMSQKELNRLKQRTGVEIITIQSSDDADIDNTIKRRIIERGYTPLSCSSNGSLFDSPITNEEFYEFAKREGKTTHMHDQSPHGSLETLRCSLLYNTNNRNSQKNRKTTEREIQKALDETEKELLDVRGGRLTRQDISSLDKIKKAIKSNDYYALDASLDDIEETIDQKINVRNYKK